MMMSAVLNPRSAEITRARTYTAAATTRLPKHVLVVPHSAWKRWPRSGCSRVHSSYRSHRTSPLLSFSKEAATAPHDTPVQERWWAVPPANAVHLAIGSVYCYSMWTPGMTHTLGVVSSSALDWTLADVVPVWSASAIVLGITTSTLGSWVESVGPRKAALVGSALWSSALLTTAAGVHWHSLPLVYLGWGVLGGMGWGMLYLAPITAVMKWFPDRRGLAAGVALSAFGAGAAIAPSVIQGCIDYYAVAPDYIGPLQMNLGDSLSSALHITDHVTLTTLEDGTQVVAESSKLGTPGTQVVVATETDIAKHSFHLHGPGAYVLGTGDSGTSSALATLSVCYGGLGVLGARYMRLPHPNWTPESSTQESAAASNTSPSIAEKTSELSDNNYGLPVDYVVRRTMQFPLLWLSVFGYATGGLALVSSSKVLLTDLWANLAPSLVTPAFATAYVSSLGFGMAAGRFGWSALSDKIGRRNTYTLFGVVSLPIVALCPKLTLYAMYISSLSSSETVSTALLTPFLALFCGGSVLAITFYGGVLSVLPAYIADLFGPKHYGALHGKLLTAWASSAVVGPMGLTYLRQQSAHNATMDLLAKVKDEAAFEHAFGCSLQDTSSVETLIDAKTLTIARLMELVPVGTVDPTPFLYDTTCYAAAALMGVSLISNWMVHPIDVRQIQRQLESTTGQQQPASSSTGR